MQVGGIINPLASVVMLAVVLSDLCVISGTDVPITIAEQIG